MPRGVNASLAVTEYDRLRTLYNYTSADAWKGIAELLLTCDTQRDKKWIPFHNVVVYREVNDFKIDSRGQPNATIRKAESLTTYLAQQLGCPRDELCSRIGSYWRHPLVEGLQPNNLVGHAFRSIVAEILKLFGAPGIVYDEEVGARDLLPHFVMSSRSKEPMIDIVASKGPRPVAMISTRWRFRHDRVDFIDEAHSYAPAAARSYGAVPYFAVMGEFSAARVGKVLDNSPPAATGPISAGIHFCPDLLSKGLGENGRMANLKGLDWLIAQTRFW
jgi:hypothetical protein